jgi:hypothetical protein
MGQKNSTNRNTVTLTVWFDSPKKLVIKTVSSTEAKVRMERKGNVCLVYRDGVEGVWVEIEEQRVDFDDKLKLVIRRPGETIEKMNNLIAFGLFIQTNLRHFSFAGLKNPEEGSHIRFRVIPDIMEIEPSCCG